MRTPARVDMLLVYRRSSSGEYCFPNIWGMGLLLVVRFVTAFNKHFTANRGYVHARCVKLEEGPAGHRTIGTMRRGRVDTTINRRRVGASTRTGTHLYVRSNRAASPIRFPAGAPASSHVPLVCSPRSIGLAYPHCPAVRQ